MSLDRRHSQNSPRPRTLSPSPHVNTGRRTDDPSFRVARARLGAYALHHKRPEIAVQAGRRGGEATSQRFPLGPKAWGIAMAMRRWHKTDFSYSEDRNHSPKTVRWYSDMLGRFADALGPEARTRDIDAESIRRYLRSVRANGFSKFTIHAYARTLKTFLR